jgi:Major Facilitator Superfamily
MSAHDFASSPPLPTGRRVAADWRRWAALPVVLAGTFMVVLDFFIVNVAMPAMQADLHASTVAIEWVVAGYGLTFATLLIAAARLGDQHGRRRMFSLGLALFTLASAACGLAWSPTARAPLRARVARRAREPARRRGDGARDRRADRARPAARRGPTARLAGVDVAVAHPRARGARRVRPAPAQARPPRRRPAARPGPVPRPRLHRRADHPARVLCAQASFFLVFALYLQLGRGLDALQAGLVFTILAVAYLAASMKAPALTPGLGRRLPATGALVLATGHALLAASVAGVGTTGPIDLLAPALLLVGAGMGLVITPLTATVLGSLEPQGAARRPARCRRCSRSATRSAWPSPASSSSGRCTPASRTRSR